MIYKHYNRKEHLVYFLLVVVGFFVLAKGYGATTLGSNIQSDGNLVLASTTSAVVFSNGWKLSQTTATTTEITVSDSLAAPVLIFDQN